MSKKTSINTNPTFNDFVNESFISVFNGLITGGTKEMKSQLHLYFQYAINIANNGGFRPGE